MNQICDRCDAALFINKIFKWYYNNDKIEIITFETNVL